MSLLDVTSAGAIPALQKLASFAAQRHTVIAGNIANISTPGYLQQDVSVRDFQRTLAQAVDARRAATGGTHGDLRLAETRELRSGPDGRLMLVPTTESGAGGLLLNDRNNRDVESLMQGLVENATTFRVANDLLRSRFELIRSAIAERV
jgi:flagellar basal-body rod protein FlgB